MKIYERKIEFDEGIFKDYFIGFINHQRNLGLKYGYGTIYTLRSLNRAINAMNPSEPSITKTMVESLISRLPDELAGSQQKGVRCLTPTYQLIVYLVKTRVRQSIGTRVYSNMNAIIKVSQN